MKKLLKGIATITVLIILICLVTKLGMLEFSIFAIEDEQLNKYSSYYYNQLTQEEQRVYIKLDEAIKNKDKSVQFIGLETEDLNNTIVKILNAYFYDNPECFYISNKYIIKNIDLKVCKFTTLDLEYIIDNKYTIDRMSEKMRDVICDIINENINSGMTDYEKELALHDALVKKVEYYKYEDIDKIPAIKHTAYSALVEGEAVCDGFSKAFSLLLEQVGIENTIINGIAEDLAHAWNIVKLDNEWYHVDVTSDKIQENNKQYVIHRYFNMTDRDIKQEYLIDDDFYIPNCNGTQYDYYTKENLYIKYEDNLYKKLKTVIEEQRNREILEIKVDSQYNAQSIIDALYALDFNNWSSSKKTSVWYNKIHNVYVFVK